MSDTRENEIDAETIIARIREHLGPKGDTGEGVTREGALPISSPRGAVSVASDIMTHHIHSLQFLQDPRPQGPLASHGSEILAWVKRLLRLALAPYHRAIFARQAEFNAHVVALMGELLRTLETTHASSLAVLEEVQTRLDALQASQAQQTAVQHEALAGVAARLDALQASQAQQTAVQHEALAGVAARLEALQAAHAQQTTAQHEALTGVAARLENQLKELTTQHVDLAGHGEEQRQEIILQKRRLELILSEIRNRITEGQQSLETIASLKDRLMDHSYFLFEKRYRGTREDIKKRQEIYLLIFRAVLNSSDMTHTTAPPVIVDIGCGRGEFLELLREHGISARGIDNNEDMVYVCKDRGLDVAQADAIDYLRAQSDDSLGGIFACQVIEHLPMDEMIEVIKLSYQKLKKGGRAVFETPNPLNVVVSATHFYQDPTHVRQVHPETLQFLVEAVGFKNTEVKFLAPYPDYLKLQLLSSNDAVCQEINRNFKRLNDVLFGYQDYAVICEKQPTPASPRDTDPT